MPRTPTGTRRKPTSKGKGKVGKINGKLQHKGRKPNCFDFPELTHHQKSFLVAYSELGNLTAAAETAGLVRQNHYRWLGEAPYAAAFKIVEEVAVERLEAEARRRAMEGSDVLLIFLLKGARPERYRDNHRIDLQGQLAHQAEVKHEHHLAPETLTDDKRLDGLRTLLGRVHARRAAEHDRSGVG